MNDGSRNTSDELWMIAAVIVAPLLMWWAWSDRFVVWAFQLKLAQLKLLHALGSGTADRAELAAALRGALTAPHRIDFDTFQFGLSAVGVYLRGPVAVALAGLGAWLLFLHPAGRFRRRFDLKALAEALREPWPYALHALRRGNLDLPLDHPVWGMALSGAAFLQKGDLLERTEAGWTLRAARAEAALASQLGAPWNEAPAHAQALAGLFALRITGCEMSSDDAEAERLKKRAFEGLRALARSAANHPVGDYLPPAAAHTRVIVETAPYLRAVLIQQRIAGHAYTQTVLLRLLADARSGGVLPTALFSWLKGVDRPLWYTLSSLGRRVHFVEALGAISHYEAERRAGVALYPPVLEAAIAGLRREVEQWPPTPADSKTVT